MRPLKIILRMLALTCFGISKLISVWPWMLLIICILSPISPHMRIPYVLSYANCDYIGTRGIVSKIDGECSLVEIIDTRAHTTRWSL